jgi:hypothetical protein
MLSTRVFGLACAVAVLVGTTPHGPSLTISAERPERAIRSAPLALSTASAQMPATNVVWTPSSAHGSARAVHTELPGPAGQLPLIVMVATAALAGAASLRTPRP